MEIFLATLERNEMRMDTHISGRCMSNLTKTRYGTLNVKIPYHCTNYALFQNFVYCISMIKKINYYTDIERDVDGYIYVLEL